MLRALATRDGSARAIGPRLERHAARLEGLSDAQVRSDPEALARALRGAVRLYALDTVTLGADGLAVADATREMAGSGPGPDDLPEPASVAGAPRLRLLAEAGRRLRAALGERAGIAFVLPSPRLLADQLGNPDGEQWALSTLVEVVRSLGPDEPDLFLELGSVAGRTPGDEALDALADHFGVARLSIRDDLPDGGERGVLLCDPVFDPAHDTVAGAGTWFVTTRGECRPEASPARVRAVLAGLRA